MHRWRIRPEAIPELLQIEPLTVVACAVMAMCRQRHAVVYEVLERVAGHAERIAREKTGG